MKLPNKRLIIIIGSIGILLSIPLIAMQFSNEVNWSLSDFIVMGFLLSGFAAAYELISRKARQTTYRIALAIALLSTFLLCWVNGAVGIIGNENQSANTLFGAVYVVGIIGSILAGFKAQGMAKVLFATAFTQILIPIIAFIIWPPPATSWAPGIFSVFLLTTFFALLFITSAILFRRAGMN